ncbi:hypothetical protein N665_1095s0003 [Sinapis alba]|nr:hypothetical protein N665_1095s0003 [Sinapis alba]
MFLNEEKPLTLLESNEVKLELDDMKSIQDKRDKWLLFPRRTICELLASTQVEKCLVICTVYAIDSDWGWYYFGCCICNKKVVKVGSLVKTSNGKEITTHLWWCEICKENVSNVSPRFKLHLMVKDDTGETNLMLLDLAAKGMIVESASKLLNGSFDELEDPTDLPPAILSVVGKTFTFGVSVEKEHVLYGSEIYKVGKIYKERIVALTDSVNLENSQSDQVLTLTSGDETSVNLIDSEEYIWGLSTPSTKRKEQWIESAPDITSTTKKPCSKAIKVEKMTDLEAEASNPT